jgi:hypothetical protein
MEATLKTEVINVTAKIADALNQYRRYHTRIYIQKTIAGSVSQHLVTDPDMSIFDVRTMISLCPENIRYIKSRMADVVWEDKLYIELNPGTTLVVFIPEGYEIHPENYKKVSDAS